MINAALPVRDCSEDEPLDAIIPFSSLILLGVVVAVEDRYKIRITREQLARASARVAQIFGSWQT